MTIDYWHGVSLMTMFGVAWLIIAELPHRRRRRAHDSKREVCMEAIALTEAMGKHGLPKDARIHTAIQHATDQLKTLGIKSSPAELRMITESLISQSKKK